MLVYERLQVLIGREIRISELNSVSEIFNVSMDCFIVEEPLNVVEPEQVSL